MYFLLTGEFMPAQQALEHHLINEILVDEDALFARARAIAEKIASHPAVAVRVEMETYYRSFDLSREENMRYAMNLYRLQRMGYSGYGAGTGFLNKGGNGGA
jgi:enoyl-CoA hydratase/carnithine racemase